MCENFDCKYVHIERKWAQEAVEWFCKDENVTEYYKGDGPNSMSGKGKTRKNIAYSTGFHEELEQKGRAKGESWGYSWKKKGKGGSSSSSFRWGDGS